MRKERDITIGSSAQVVLEIVLIAKPELVEDTHTYKQQISKSLWNIWKILVAILRIARTSEHRNSMQKLCGGIPRAYTCTHWFALRRILANNSGKAQPAKTTKKKNGNAEIRAFLRSMRGHGKLWPSEG
jgi:hypothetical protein